MADNVVLKDLCRGLQNKMKAELCLDRSCIIHSGTKGSASERCWKDFFRKYLPKTYSVDSGFVIDHEGNISDQIDIIIYNSNYTPLVFNHGGCLYIPVECVLAVFEVKQTVNSVNIQCASDRAASVRSQKFAYRSASNSIILAGLLSTECEWSEKKLEETASKQEGLRSLDYVCSIDNVSLYIIYDDVPFNLINQRKPINHRLKYGKKNCGKHSDDNSDVFALATFFYQLCDGLFYANKRPSIDFDKYLEVIGGSVRPYDCDSLI